jgi:histidyl-tRNA synthetase
VFEIFDTHPDNNRSVFGGGRYNGLVSLFDEENIAAVGAAAGDTGITNFLEVRGLLPKYTPPTSLYIALTSPSMLGEALKLATELRNNKVTVAVDFGEKKLSDQIKTASKHGVPYLLVVGEDELKNNSFAVRDLESGSEKQLARSELSTYFS